MSATGAAGLRAWSNGGYYQEAGVELLIRAFDGRFAQHGCPWVKPCDRPGLLWLDVAVLVDHLGVLSRGEQRVLTVVAALVDGSRGVDLGDILVGLDRRNLRLVLAALSHAAGSHQHSTLVCEGDGLVLVALPPLVPWQDDAAGWAV